MTEEWKVAAGTDGRYEVSNIGRVRRFDGVMLSVSVPKNARSYPAVMMRYGGRRVRRAVHRLVAVNFISPPPFDGAEVRHLDGNHMNPRLDNLAWGTRTDNAADREAHGRTARGATHGKLGVGVYGERNGNYRVTPEMKRAACELVRSGKTQRQAAAEIGITQKSVWQAVRAIAWSMTDD